MKVHTSSSPKGFDVDDFLGDVNEWQKLYKQILGADSMEARTEVSITLVNVLEKLRGKAYDDGKKYSKSHGCSKFITCFHLVLFKTIILSGEKFWQAFKIQMSQSVKERTESMARLFEPGQVQPSAVKYHFECK